jgi:hypothetical protein
VIPAPTARLDRSGIGSNRGRNERIDRAPGGSAPVFFRHRHSAAYEWYAPNLIAPRQISIVSLSVSGSVNFDYTLNQKQKSSLLSKA